MIRHLLLIAAMAAATWMGVNGAARAQADSEAPTIEGRVVDQNGAPVPGINIMIKGTSKGAATGDNGYFEITGISHGRHTLVASGIGYKRETRQIELERGMRLELEIVLSTQKEELQEVVVQSHRINKYAGPGSEYVAKVPLPDLDNPQVYNTISSELMQDQVVTNFEQAMRNAPGLFKLWESTGRGGDGSGYYALRGFDTQPTMKNGLPALTNGSPDPAGVERIEVVKGPSATLYGGRLTSYGGLINVVTKKPYDRFGGQVSYKTGSYGLNRITADVNTPVGEEEKLAVRAIGAYHSEGSFQDAGFKESFYLAPALSYEVNERLSFDVHTEFYSSEHTNPVMLFLNRSAELEFEDLDELNYHRERSYTSNDLTISNPTMNLQARMSYEFSGNWRSETSVSRSRAKTEGLYSYLWDFAPANGVFGRYINDQNSTTYGTNIQQNFIGQFELAGLGNTLAVGLDYYRSEVTNNSSGYILFDNVTMGEADTSEISKPAVKRDIAGASITKSTTEEATYSLYATDILDITPRLSVMGALRLDHFVNRGTENARTGRTTGDYEQTALSPRAGIRYQPLEDKVSLFANYMNGFNNVAPRSQADGSTKSFEPERASQWETGVKTSWLGGRLDATVTYYNITVSNIVREDPDRVNYYIQDGQNYSRGIEASVSASPVRGLNLKAGYSHNISEITETGNPALEGRRPESAGPQDLFNGWASYEFQGGTLEGFGIRGGLNYAGENKIMNRSTTGTFTLPAFTVVNAALSYNTAEYRLDLRVNNLGDKAYYKGWSTVNPQMPRNVTANFTYKF